MPNTKVTSYMLFRCEGTADNLLGSTSELGHRTFCCCYEATAESSHTYCTATWDDMQSCKTFDTPPQISLLRSWKGLRVFCSRNGVFPSRGVIFPGLVFFVPVVFFCSGRCFWCPGICFFVPGIGLSATGIGFLVPLGTFGARKGFSCARLKWNVLGCFWFPFRLAISIS